MQQILKLTKGMQIDLYKKETDWIDKSKNEVT